MDSFWNEENTALAVKLWDQGLSATQIAHEIGAKTRNVIIGKINRLRNAGVIALARPPAMPGTQERSRVSKAGGTAAHATRVKVLRKKRKSRATGKKREHHNNFAAYNAAKRAAEPTPVFVAPPVIIDASSAKLWTERRFGECAYPIGGEGADTLSCCGPTKGKTYCVGHRKVMFRKPDDTGKRFVNGIARLAA